MHTYIVATPNFKIRIAPPLAIFARFGPQQLFLIPKLFRVKHFDSSMKLLLKRRRISKSWSMRISLRAYKRLKNVGLSIATEFSSILITYIDNIFCTDNLDITVFIPTLFIKHFNLWHVTL